MLILGLKGLNFKVISKLSCHTNFSILILSCVQVYGYVVVLLYSKLCSSLCGCSIETIRVIFNNHTCQKLYT